MVDIMKSGTIVSASFAAVMLASPALAQSSAGSAFSYTKAVPFFNPASVEPILRAMGHKATKARTKSGKSYLQVTAKNGLKFNVHFAACADTTVKKCKGLSMSAFWGKLQRFSISETADRARKFNNKYNFIKASVFDNGKPYILRYTIADYGTNQGNIRAELANFVALGSKFTKEVIGAE